MIRAEFQPGEVVAFRLFGAEVQGEICAILGPRASVQITHAPHFPRLIGTAWCVYQRRLTRFLHSGNLFAELNCYRGEPRTANAPHPGELNRDGAGPAVRGEHASLATRTT